MYSILFIPNRFPRHSKQNVFNGRVCIEEKTRLQIFQSIGTIWGAAAHILLYFKLCFVPILIFIYFWVINFPLLFMLYFLLFFVIICCLLFFCIITLFFYPENLAHSPEKMKTSVSLDDSKRVLQQLLKLGWLFMTTGRLYPYSSCLIIQSNDYNHPLTYNKL